MLVSEQIWNKQTLTGTVKAGEQSVRQSQYLRPVLDDIRYNPAAEVVRYARGRADVLSLGQGEGDAPTPSFITDAAIGALQRGKTFYGPPLGLPETRRALSDYYKDIYELDISPSRMVLTPSGTAAIHLAMLAVCDKGDEVVAVTPLWKNLLGAIQLQEARATEVTLDEQDGVWSLDLQKLFDSVTPLTKAIILNSPSNPTGWIMSEDDMRIVMDFARERGIWVISDEVYGRMIYGTKRAPSFLDVSEPDDRLIVINSFSKNWAMTGWRLGWMVVPKEAEQKIYDIILYDYMCPQVFTQYAAIEALRGGEDFITEQMNWFEKARDIVHARFAQMDRIIAHPPAATFYSFFRIEGQEDCLTLCRRLVDKTGLCLAPGCAFGKEAGGYIRMCFAVSEPKLQDALSRLERMVQSH
jgi:aspartate/methionine/tyrosine aminotransferase